MNPRKMTAWSSPERGVGKYLQELLSKRKQIFAIDDTVLAADIPLEEMREAKHRVPQYFHSGDYEKRKPDGVFSWV